MSVSPQSRAAAAIRARDPETLLSILRCSAAELDLSQLILAAVEVDYACSEALLAHGARPETTSAGGNSVLYYAATEGHANIVRLLLERGAATDGPVTAPRTPLMGAALYGKLSVARALVAVGADLDRDSLLGTSSPLSCADEDAPFEVEPRKEVATYLRSVGATKPWDHERAFEFWEDAVGELTIRLVEGCLGIVSAIPLHDELTEFARIVVRRTKHGWSTRFQTLFTCGLPEQGGGCELALPLTSKWPLHRTALEQGLFNRPVKFLAAAADRLLTGVKVEHGDVVGKEHPLVAGLEWPGDFAQWLVVEHSSFTAKRAEFAADPNPNVRGTELPRVMLLVPHLEKKPLKPGEEAKRKADAKAAVKWEKPAAGGGRNNLVVPLCYKPTWTALGDPEGTWY